METSQAESELNSNNNNEIPNKNYLEINPEISESTRSGSSNSLSDLRKSHLRDERFNKCFSSEDYKKIQSESTSIISDSSGDAYSESYTDSDTNSYKSLAIKSNRKVKTKEIKI